MQKPSIAQTFKGQFLFFLFWGTVIKFGWMGVLYGLAAVFGVELALLVIKGGVIVCKFFASIPSEPLAPLNRNDKIAMVAIPAVCFAMMLPYLLGWKI